MKSILDSIASTHISKAKKYEEDKSFYEGRRAYTLFRGQCRDEWKLLPNLTRTIKDPVRLKQDEENAVREFKQEVLKKGFGKMLETKSINRLFHEDWLLIQQSQHFGVPTRFMDWTSDWKVALFFCVFGSNEEDEHDDVDGLVWTNILSSGLMQLETDTRYADQNPFEFEKTIFLNSSSFLDASFNIKLAMRRKDQQHGWFCIQSYENSLIPLEEQKQITDLFKITIPKAIKPKIRAELKDGGITKESIYVFTEPEIEDVVRSLRKKYQI